MKELVVISGKGGTGKTILMAAFASLAEKIAFVMLTWMLPIFIFSWILR